MYNDALSSPPPAVSSYSIARNRTMRDIRALQRCVEDNLVVSILNVVESVESSEELSTKAFCGVDLFHDVFWLYLVTYELYVILLLLVIIQVNSGTRGNSTKRYLDLS